MNETTLDPNQAYHNNKPIFNVDEPPPGAVLIDLDGCPAYECNDKIVVTHRDWTAHCREGAEQVRRKDFIEPATKECERAQRDLINLQQAVLERYNSLQHACETYIKEIRDIRMVVVADVSHLLAHYKDIRQLFCGPDHTAEMARLREFVELCERLYALQKAGFVDKMADVLLRLSEEKPDEH
jgi:hypothetical protein